MAQNFVPLKNVANVKQCGSPFCPFSSSRPTLLSLPLLSLVSSQVVWNTGDGAKYAGDTEHNETVASAIVADGVVDLSTGELN